MHLTIDGFGGDRELLSDESLLRSLLNRLPGEINMTKISEPHVFRYVGDKAEDWGISGFVLIAESHIAVHTFPERGLIWADVFSCKAFDGDDAAWIIASEFNIEAVRVQKLDRGLEYPHSVAEATPLAMYGRRVVTGALAGTEA